MIPLLRNNHSALAAQSFRDRVIAKERIDERIVCFELGHRKASAEHMLLEEPHEWRSLMSAVRV